MSTLSGLQADIELPHDQEFELYHNALSLCSMKSRLCLAELKIPYKSHHIDLIETGAYENIRAPFAAINPAKTVPVLLHNGHPVYESHEQIRYAALHAAAGVPSLLPKDPQLRSEMERWVDLSSLTENPFEESEKSAGNAIPGQTLPLFATMIERIPYRKIAVGFLFHFDKRRPLLFSMMKWRGLQSLATIPPLNRALSTSRAHMHRHLQSLEQQLSQSGGPWILGSQYTLADVSWTAILERLRQADALDVFVARAGRTAIENYWNSLRQRTSYAQAISLHEHHLVLYGTHRIQALKQADPEIRRLLEGEPD